MELRQIRYFVAVADAGSVTGAARVVHVGQPSLSRQLHQLERELDLQLFVQNAGRLQLTAGGRAFLSVARELVSTADQAKDAAHNIASGRLQQITIAAPSVTLTDVLAPFIATLGREDPMPSVSDLAPHASFEVLDAGVDLLIATSPPPSQLSRCWITRLPVLAYVHPDHELASRRSVPIATLVEQDLLLPTRDSHTRWTLDAAALAAGVGYRSFSEFTSSQVAQAVAAAGRGVAVVSDDARFGLSALPITSPAGPLHLDLYAVWPTEHHAASTLSEFARRLSSYVVSRYGPTSRPGTPELGVTPASRRADSLP